MDESRPRTDKVPENEKTHEDAAATDSWANLQGARYRDFTAARQAFHASQRQVAAQQQRDTEMGYAREREETGRRAILSATDALAAAIRSDDASERALTVRRAAEEGLQRAEMIAAQHFEEAQRHTQAADTLKQAAEAAGRESAEARRQARGEDRHFAEEESTTEVPPATAGEYRRERGFEGVHQKPRVEPEMAIFHQEIRFGRSRESEAPWTGEERRSSSLKGVAADSVRAYRRRAEERQRPEQADEEGSTELRGVDQPSGGRLSPIRFEEADPAPEGATRLLIPSPPVRPQPPEEQAVEERYLRMRRPENAASREDGVPVRSGYRDERVREGNQQLDRRAVPREPAAPRKAPEEYATDLNGLLDKAAEALPTQPPAWLAGQAEPTPLAPDQEPVLAPSVQWIAAHAASPLSDHSRSETPVPSTSPFEQKPAAISDAPPAAEPPAETLQESREMVAARWYALNGLLGSPAAFSSVPRGGEAVAPVRRETISAPMLAVVSLSGGVGKTSLVATLGRALSSLSEKVLLTETSPQGLLPYYFGARALRPRVLRTFSPPPGSSDAPVHMANLEPEHAGVARDEQVHLLEDLTQRAEGTERILLDMDGSQAWMAQRLAKSGATILVPLSADMNSVIGIQRAEDFFAGMTDKEGRPVRPWYVLNQFDASLPLHLDVREVLRRQLVDRLLSIVIRRSPAVAEALAEGMTVIDYAPGSLIAGDYLSLAAWVRSLAPAQMSLRGARWSEL